MRFTPLADGRLINAQDLAEAHPLVVGPNADHLKRNVVAFRLGADVAPAEYWRAGAHQRAFAHDQPAVFLGELHLAFGLPGPGGRGNAPAENEDQIGAELR